MIHELKTIPEYFEAIIKGEKLFEIRKEDRGYKVGDLLALNEYDSIKNIYTGRSCLVYIDYILSNSIYCKDGYITMSIKPCEVGKKSAPFDFNSIAPNYCVPLATGAEK